MANPDSAKQVGSEQSGKTRQQQGEQGYVGQQGSAQQGSSARQVTQGNQTSPAHQGGQPVQRYGLFESFFSNRPRRSRQMDMPTLWSPEVDIREDKDQLRVRVDLPGIPKDAVKIDIHDGALTVQGERSEERSDESQGQGYRRTERRYGSFYRSIPLPEGADAEKARASMKEGVLEITIPVPERKQARRLEIQS